MKWQTINPRARLYLIATIVLIVGLGIAITVYLTAESSSDNTWVREFESSKRYEHELEVYGGEMNVLLDRFNRWFAGLWHGKSLAYTIACITIVVSAGIFLVAFASPSNPKPAAPAEKNE